MTTNHHDHQEDAMPTTIATTNKPPPYVAPAGGAANDPLRERDLEALGITGATVTTTGIGQVSATLTTAQLDRLTDGTRERRDAEARADDRLDDAMGQVADLEDEVAELEAKASKREDEVDALNERIAGLQAMADEARPTWTASKHGELWCPLPVLRNQWSDTPDGDPVVQVGKCGAAVFLTREQSGELGIDGEADDYGRSWKVECAAGHVLVFNDDGDMSPTVEPAPELIVAALGRIAAMPNEEAGADA